MEGRVAIVTGVGREAGIGFALARRLLDDGWSVLAHSLDGAPLERSERLRLLEADLGDSDAASRVIGNVDEKLVGIVELHRVVMCGRCHTAIYMIGSWSIALFAPEAA